MNATAISLLDALHAAALWSAENISPPAEWSRAVVNSSDSVAGNAENIRELLWNVLSYPERARSLEWLDKIVALQIILPAWNGDTRRRDLRIRAVEEVHLEKWICGLSNEVFKKICAEQDCRVDNRMNGWALTGLATLLLSGDGDANVFASRIESDLEKIGATKSEIKIVSTAIREFPALMNTLPAGKIPPQKASLSGTIGTLATLFADKRFTDDHRTQAILTAGKMIAA